MLIGTLDEATIAFLTVLVAAAAVITKLRCDVAQLRKESDLRSGDRDALLWVIHQLAVHDESIKRVHQLTINTQRDAKRDSDHLYDLIDQIVDEQEDRVVARVIARLTSQRLSDLPEIVVKDAKATTKKSPRRRRATHQPTDDGIGFDLPDS